jgi:hypothetical protein
MKTITSFIVALLFMVSCHEEVLQEEPTTNEPPRIDSLAVLKTELSTLNQRHNSLQFFSDSLALDYTQLRQKTAMAEIARNSEFKPVDSLGYLDIWRFRREFESNEQIMLAGVYHDFEIRKDIDKLNWFGLYINDKGVAKLRKCKLKVESIDDPVAGDVSGKHVFAKGKEKPLVLLYGFDWLSKRTLTKSMHLNKNYYPGTIDRIDEIDGAYTLAALGESGMAENGNLYDYPIIKNYTISLVKRDYDAKKSMVQHVTASGDLSMTGQPFAVLWVGDIDGDDKPDLIITKEYDYNAGGSVSLYLSSEAKGKKMVQLVSHFHGVGC